MAGPIEFCAVALHRPGPMYSPGKNQVDRSRVDEGERRHVVGYPLDFPIGKDGRDRGGEVGFCPDNESGSVRE